MSPQPNSVNADHQKFSDLKIHPKLLEVLSKLNFHTPTPIQSKAIPVVLEGKDIIGIAQTGTGKTLAFALPMIERLIQVKGRGVVVLPTRELALQVEDVFRKVGGSFGLRTALLIGGADIGRQKKDLRLNPHVIIGTPGRMIDHLQQRTLPLNDVRVLVLDEADRMLDMGFAPQIKKILEVVPRDRQTLLFSATMPDNIVKIATQHMKLPVRIEVSRPGTTVERVVQEIFIIEKSRKDQLLEAILKECEGTALIFSRTKYGAKKICRKLNQIGYKSAEIHSNRSLSQRREALDGFKSGKYKVLVATDIAARGIDVIGIELVLNYDIPEFAEDYVHRIGRTGRAGEEGHAITFAMPDQRDKIRQIERLIEDTLLISDLPQLPDARPSEPYSPRPSRGSRPGQSSKSPHGARPSHGGKPSYRGGGQSGGQKHYPRRTR